MRGAIPPLSNEEWLTGLPLIDPSDRTRQVGIFVGTVDGHTNPVFVLENGMLRVLIQGSDQSGNYLWVFDLVEGFKTELTQGGIASGIIAASGISASSANSIVVGALTRESVSKRLLPA